VGAFDSERREFVRISVAIPVRYRFLCDEFDHPELSKMREGDTSNLSGGGLLLRATIPDLDWLPYLLSGRMRVGVNLVIPDCEMPVKALARVAWVEGLDEETAEASLGLVFREITRDARDEVLRYVIETRLPD
jgi:c-di-GMP-binding flagellar brake protein YcgR